MKSIKYEAFNKDLIEEVSSLISENHALTGQFEVLNIDWDMYLNVSDNMIPIVLRIDDEIQGLLLFYVGPYPHNKDEKHADQLTFYVKPDHREWAKHMMSFAEDFMTAIECDFILQSARFGSYFCTTLEKRGYSPLDVKYVMRLR